MKPTDKDTIWVYGKMYSETPSGTISPIWRGVVVQIPNSLVLDVQATGEVKTEDS